MGRRQPPSTATTPEQYRYPQLFEGLGMGAPEQNHDDNESTGRRRSYS